MYMFCRSSEKTQNPKTGNAKYQKHRSDHDGPPDDINAFFGHPLTAATTAINGEDTSASAAALQYEYMNLPGIDRNQVQNGQKQEVEKPEESQFPPPETM